MTMPNAYPGPDPEEFKRHTGDAERFDGIFDAIDVMNLVDELHIYRQGAIELDNHTRQKLSAMKHFGESAVRQATYLRPLVFNDEVSIAPYDEMVWVPRPPIESLDADAATSGSEVLEGVEFIFLRFPQLAGQRFNIPDDELPRETNDALIEVQRTDGTTYRYVINSRGITPYTDAEALDFDDSEMEREGIAPNVFQVSTDFWHIPPLSPTDLRQMLAGSTPLPISA